MAEEPELWVPRAGPHSGGCSLQLSQAGWQFPRRKHSHEKESHSFVPCSEHHPRQKLLVGSPLPVAKPSPLSRTGES